MGVSGFPRPDGNRRGRCRYGNWILASGSGPVLFVGADGESHQVKVPIKGEHFLYPQPLAD